MRNKWLIGFTVITAAGALAGCGSAEGSDPGRVELSFVSLAWQPQAIEANKSIVDEWNEQHPDVHVTYVQGDWGSIADQLTTEFVAGKAPDLFHYYDIGLARFATDGYVLDIEPLLSEEFKGDIRPEAWENVSFDGLDGIYGVPFLQEPFLLYANKSLLEAHDVPVPAADDPWTWDEFQDYARQLTVDEDGDGTPEVYGTAMPLADGGVDNTLSLAMSFDAGFFSDDGTSVQWGDAEAEVPARFHAMMYDDKVMSTDVLGLGTVDVIPPFIAGKYATIFGGAFLRQQIDQAATNGFAWVALPPLEGTSRAQNNAAQTISISAQTDHPEEAEKFLEFFLNPDNQVELALGDWLTPTSISAANSDAFADLGKGWDVVLAATEDLTQGAFHGVAGYDAWVGQVAGPAFSDYYRNKISLDELGTRLVEEGNPVIERAAGR